MPATIEEIDQGFILEARTILWRYLNTSHTLKPTGWVVLDDVRTLWAAKLRKDWKVAMTITGRGLDNKRYLVSYDCGIQETTVDSFTMIDGVAVQD